MPRRNAAIDPNIDLTTCDQEPLHLIGSIQPHGVLLAVQVDDLRISHASTNADSLLAVSAQELIGKPIEQFVSAKTYGLIRQFASGDLSEPALQLVSAITGSSAELVVSIHKSGAVLIVELEPLSELAGEEVTYQVVDRLSKFFSTNDMTEAFSLICTEVQQITDFDRVLLYRFDDDWSGSVVAESRRDFMPSYLHHQFPGSDIPKQARELYVKNRIRLLVDVHSAPSPVVPAIDATASVPLDLSFSILRSMSPVHIEYLKNMGVSTSMSISIVKDGQLWASLPAISKSPNQLITEQEACAQFWQMSFPHFLAALRMSSAGSIRYRCPMQTNLLHKLRTYKKLVSVLLSADSEVLSLTNARGFAVYFETELGTTGLVPPDETIFALLQWLDKDTDSSYFATHSLSSVYPGGKGITGQASGVLAIPVPFHNRSWLLWFRPEEAQEIAWAGNPNKPCEITEGQLRLHPRTSFATWKELVRGKSQPWRDFEIGSAVELRNSIVDFALEQVSEKQMIESRLRKQSEEFQKRGED